MKERDPSPFISSFRAEFIGAFISLRPRSLSTHAAPGTHTSHPPVEVSRTPSRTVLFALRRYVEITVRDTHQPGLEDVCASSSRSTCF